jgi:penicillin amidase
LAKRATHTAWLGFLTIAFLAAWAAWSLHASLPPANESLHCSAGLPHGAGDSIAIAYDAAGVPTVSAYDVRGLAFGQGYAHARDRRFQMELYRRTAEGRLAEWFGPVALDYDRHFRRFGFAAVADSAIARMSPPHRALLDAYAAGVNAFDRTHRAPPEWALLGGKPELWRPADALLVLAVMFDDLTWDEADEERRTERMDRDLPPALVAFLHPRATPLDVPLDDRPPPPDPPTPLPSECDVRRLEPTPRVSLVPAGLGREPRDTGSNNWAIAGTRTASGAALVAGDPHLSISVPAIWHRERLVGGGVALTGVSLPGTPGIVFGSNGRVAWTGTNVEGDFADLVRCVPADAETVSFRGPAGPVPFGERREVIRVRGARPDTLVVRTTPWGPVVGTSVRGGLLAAQWVALDPGAYQGALFDLAQATDVKDLFARFAGFGGPALNVVAGDAGGHIGFRIVGMLPRRRGFDPLRPRDAETPGAGWFGVVPVDSMPGVLDPPTGFVATANQRTVGGAIGDAVFGMPAMPWRVRRIATQLAAHGGWTAADCARLQVDVDDSYLAPTAEAILHALPDSVTARDTDLRAVRDVVRGWDRRADTTSVAHAYLVEARAALVAQLLSPLVAPCVRADSTFDDDWALNDEVVRRLLTERPPNLTTAKDGDYDVVVREAARRAVERLARRTHGLPLARSTWGVVNRADYAHPFGHALPLVGGVLDHWLDLPHAALEGGSNVVRMARPRSGASMRMVCDLADPTRSRFALPGGQSGHFLSPHYADGFADWVAGVTKPLEPGPPAHRVRLVFAP